MAVSRQVGCSVSLLIALVALPASVDADLLYTWGRNHYGQMGDPDTSLIRLSPTHVTLPGEVTAASVGDFHNLAVVDGTAYAWGYNLNGALGVAPNPPDNYRATPLPVEGLTSGVTAVSAGLYHSLALKNGALYAFGRNTNGQLGNGDLTGTNSHIPVAVQNLDSNVTSFHVGGYHNVAIKGEALYVWGRNNTGQLGNGGGSSRVVPFVPNSIFESGVTAASASNHTLVVKNGAVYSFGYNYHGQLGTGEWGTGTDRNTPYAIPSLSSGVTDVAAGYFHSLALKDGQVYAWGEADSGQLGLPGYGTGDPSLRFVTTPTLIPGLSNIVDIAASSYNSYALAADGSLWVFGNNQYGQLGLGDTVYRNLPTQLLPPEGYRYSLVDTGTFHALALLTPVIPEPASLMALLLPCVLLRRSRRGN